MAMINSNISALVANNAIKQNDRLMSSNMEKLATGFRINSAKDGAAGLAIALRMKSQISGLNMAVRNVNDAISMLQTAEGATKEITGMLGRMHELAIQASSETYTSSDRAALNLEYQALLSEIDSIAETAEWNGNKILAGADHTVTTNLATSKSVNIQAGADASQVLALNLNSWRPTVAVDAAMSVSGSGKNGVDDRLPEQTVVAFVSATTHSGSQQIYAVGGLTATFTNTTGGSKTLTAAQIAAIYENLEAGATAGSIAAIGSAPGVGQPYEGFTLVYTGAFTGFNSSAVHDLSKVTFTSIDQGNVTDLVANRGHLPISGAAGSVTTTDGDADNINQSAYGAGIFYAGGNLALGGGTPLAPTALNLTSVTNATAALSELEKALDGASAERAKYGAYLNRLEHAANNLSNIAMNTSASLSQIKDTDYAQEAAELARAHIISQASSAMLSQANQSKQTVLALLRE
tara:strand:+ start:2938 stop:4329 length:1392 start_codon:yes stop_codon:yes gene_type:complete